MRLNWGNTPADALTTRPLGFVVTVNVAAEVVALPLGLVKTARYSL
jgi:hypothetical protein